MRCPVHPPSLDISRRTLLRQAAWAGMATQLPRWAWAQAAVRHDPFGLGVASGDPVHDGVVLWTRVLPPADLAGTHAPWAGPLTVRWELADDAQFRHIVQRGTAMALPELGHSVHVEVAGLRPDRWYHYRFMLGDATSPVGRTRTAPAPDALPGRLRLVFASCQRWEHGHYAAWRHACADQPDLVLLLGDYIYEYPSPQDATGLARVHPLRLPRNLQDYRDRYALHKSDPALQAAHACAPWSVTWDDHEVQNDYAAGQGRGERAEWLPLRSAAWQAFYEHMPLRASTLAGSGFHQLQIHRRLHWGRLARLHMLDTRQYRDLQACRTQVGNLRLLLGCCNLFAHHSAGAHGPCECRQGAGSRFVQYPERAAQMLQLPAQLLHGGGPPGKPVRADARKAPAGGGMHIGQAHHGQQVFRPKGTRALQRALVVQPQVAAEPEQHCAHGGAPGDGGRLR